MVDALPKVMDCLPSDRPLRVAVVYSRLPFPMMRGDQLTVAHLLSFLAARGHQVDFYTLAKHGEVSRVQRDWLNRACRHVRIHSHGIGQMARGLIKGLFRREPVQVAMFRNRSLTREVKARVQAGEYDVVYCYYIRSAHAVPHALTRVGRPEDARAPVSFLAMQLSQSLNSRRIFENERHAIKRLLYRIETALCERYEARIWQRFNRAVLIGPADVATVEAVCIAQKQRPIDNWVYGAHGTDLTRYRPAMAAEVVAGRVVFSGSMLYQPNVQAVLWFVDQCWPIVRTAVPGATLIIQGRDPTAAIRDLDGRNGITVTGTVQDVGHFIRSATVCINPMRAAGGMQNKLIEYMACAKATVATSIANEGIMAPDDTLRTADDADGFAAAVIALLSDPDQAMTLGAAARAFVARHWTWEAHFLKLEEAFYDSLRQEVTAVAPTPSGAGIAG